MEVESQTGQRMIRNWSSSADSLMLMVRSVVRHQTIVPVVLGVLILTGLLSLMGHWGNDDPFITYRYADNLLAGQGFVYNVGEQTLSTTAPLYALLLAGLGLIWSDLPPLSNALSALALVVGAACLWGVSRSHGKGTAGLIAGFLYALTPLMLLTFGAETCFYLMLVLAGLYAYSRSRLFLTAGLLAVAAMVRPDAVVAAVAVGLVHIVRVRSVSWQPVILYAGLVGAWYAGLWLYFGSPLPITLLVKQQQGQMDISTRFGAGFLDLLAGYGRQPLYWLHGALAVVGLVQIVTKARHWLPLLTWTALYLLAYTLLGVSRYFWYYAPLMPAFAVLVAEGTMVLLRSVSRIKMPRLVLIAATGLVLLVLLAPQMSGVIWASWRDDPRLEVYTEIGQWLEANTPPQASVGALEVGIIGYYARRTMIDFAGLIQPDVARRFTSTTTYQESTAWAIQTYQPDYVVLHAEAFAAVSGSDWFQTTYHPVRDFADTKAQWLTLYRRSEIP
jgi:hypothetical protein